MGRRPPAAQWLILAAFLALWATRSATWESQAAEPATESKSIRLVIDYADGVQKHFIGVKPRSSMNVLQLMQQASKHPRGIKFVHRGSGATAFLTQIDNLENQGRGRNWVYRVNGKLAEKSIGLTEVKPGDTVLWKFGDYR